LHKLGWELFSITAEPVICEQVRSGQITGDNRPIFS
jgi:hypothetical protein